MLQYTIAYTSSVLLYKEDICQSVKHTLHVIQTIVIFLSCACSVCLTMLTLLCIYPYPLSWRLSASLYHGLGYICPCNQDSWYINVRYLHIFPLHSRLGHLNVMYVHIYGPTIKTVVPLCHVVPHINPTIKHAGTTMSCNCIYMPLLSKLAVPLLGVLAYICPYNKYCSNFISCSCIYLPLQ